jgi:phosphate transport system protein
MFEKFKELFGSENLLDSAFDTTLKMMEYDSQMYDASRNTLRNSDTDELPFDFKEMDGKVNKYEREVRKNVLTHLSVAGMQNLVPGLMLVSIVIDVERIGDYTKNIAGLASLHPVRLNGGSHEESLASIEAAISQNFPSVIKVMSTYEKGLAREVMQREPEVARASDQIVNDMIIGKDVAGSPGESVSLALYSRYLKRINAHLTNIASAIVNPFPRIGFSEKE